MSQRILCVDIIGIIISFLPKYELLDWVKEQEEKLSYRSLSRNPRAIDLLKINPDKIYPYLLNANPSREAYELCKLYNIQESLRPYFAEAVQILRDNPDKMVSWCLLHRNSEFLNCREDSFDKKNWSWISLNPLPEAIKLLRKNPDKIQWTYLCQNPEAIDILLENPDKIIWFFLSGNSSEKAIPLLRKNFNEIDWWNLSMNPSQGAIQILRENPDKIIFPWISLNPSAIDLLREKQSIIDWEMLSTNSGIFFENITKKILFKILS